jgi:hypothetical protein
VRERIGDHWAYELTSTDIEHATPCWVFGQCALACHALRELKVLLTEGMDEAAFEGLPAGVYVLCVEGVFSKVFTVRGGKLTAATDAAHGVNLRGLLVHVSAAAWTSLVPAKRVPMAVACAMWVNGEIALTTCVGECLPNHVECTQCPSGGMDARKLPIGVNMVQHMPSRGVQWRLPNVMEKSVDGCIGALFEGHLRRGLSVPELVDAVHGAAVLQELETSCSEWIKFIVLPGEAASVGVSRLDKEVLRWLRDRASHMKTAGRCLTKTLVTSLVERWHTGEFPEYFVGQRVRAPWLTKAGQPSKQHVQQGGFVASIVSVNHAKRTCQLRYVDDGTEHDRVKYQHISSDYS